MAIAPFPSTKPASYDMDRQARQAYPSREPSERLWLTPGRLVLIPQAALLLVLHQPRRGTFPSVFYTSAGIAKGRHQQQYCPHSTPTPRPYGRIKGGRSE